jgi:serine/threonine-protein kinase
MAHSDPNIGRLLDNRYELIELIGKGAMGRVYLARHVLLGGSVAVKFLSSTLLTEKMRDQFFNEARTCAQLGQKTIHIVRVTDFGVDQDDVPFYVMEYLQGESLGSIIQGNPLHLPRFLQVTRQICLGLKYAHEGIVVNGKNYPVIHRDIKPNNVLVNPDESMGELVKLLDFGISQFQSDDNGTKTFMGTLAYASPEQMEGKNIDQRSDIYSLGIMMFQLLTGKMPLQPESHSFGSWYKTHHFQEPRTLQSVAPHLQIPDALDSLIRSCIAKEPSDRPQTVLQLLAVLDPLNDRYDKNRSLGQRIQGTLSKVSVSTERDELKKDHSSPEEICRLQRWPADKPYARIVFPQIIPSSSGPFPTIWTMLEQVEVEKLRVNDLYNRIYRSFLCTQSPHPMMLWLTALYNRQYHGNDGPRWFNSYLDLKSPMGIELTHLLGAQGEYYILIFALENPSRPPFVVRTTIEELQCSQLKQWIFMAQSQPSVAQPTMSKDLLRNEFNKVKGKIHTRMTNYLGEAGFTSTTDYRSQGTNGTQNTTKN